MLCGENMVSKKSKIVCSVPRLEFVSLLIADQFQPNFSRLIMCINVLIPPQNHPNLFLEALSLNLQTVWSLALLFRQSPPPLDIGFLWPPPKNQIFQWTGGSKFSSLIPFHLLKVTKFFVEISQQFTFLVMKKTFFKIWLNLLPLSSPQAAERRREKGGHYEFVWNKGLQK